MASRLLHERRIAELAVLRACVLTKKVLARVEELSKADASPVTIADLAAQALMTSAVREAFPADGVVGEESSALLREDDRLMGQVYQLIYDLVTDHDVEGPEPGAKLASPSSMVEMLDLVDLGGNGKGGRQGRFWVMDPVDGTATFLRGQQYAISLALIEDGQEVLGVLACPNLKLRDGRVDEDSVDTEGWGIMLTAVRGEGATIRHLTDPKILQPAEPLPLLKPPQSDEAIHIVDCLKSKVLNHDVLAHLAKTLGARYPGTDVWSSHMRYAAMILGGGDVQVRVPANAEKKVCIWDHAGAQLVFTELGGKVTDLDGRHIDFGNGIYLNVKNRGMIITRGEIHARILKEVKGLLGE